MYIGQWEVSGGKWTTQKPNNANSYFCLEELAIQKVQWDHLVRVSHFHKRSPKWDLSKSTGAYVVA